MLPQSTPLKLSRHINRVKGNKTMAKMNYPFTTKGAEGPSVIYNNIAKGALIRSCILERALQLEKQKSISHIHTNLH